jgi:HEPN domain-containing protein
LCAFLFWRGFSLVSREIALKWFRQAEHDLLMAERNISIEAYDVSAFLAHQAVEKALKSIFCLQGKSLPKTHHIDELAGQLCLPNKLLEEVFDLAADYMLSRYPDVSDKIPYELYDEFMASEKVSRAKTIISYLQGNYWMTTR